MKLAACVLVERADGKILCVSRGDDLKDWNLPGGKRETDESAVSNAIRELAEETGIISKRQDLDLLYAGQCGDDFWCDSFRIPWVRTRGVIRPSAEGSVAWKDWADILAENSSFREYNRELFARVASA